MGKGVKEEEKEVRFRLGKRLRREFLPASLYGGGMLTPERRGRKEELLSRGRYYISHC